jgi:hypothetical protein
MFNRRAGCLGNPLVRFCEGLGGNRETGAALPTRLEYCLSCMLSSLLQLGIFNWWMISIKLGLSRWKKANGFFRID